MTTADAILADIVADPADDTPRLIYADWLEENGYAVQAKFIRSQIRLAAMEREFSSGGPLPKGHPAYDQWWALYQQTLQIAADLGRPDCFGLAVQTRRGFIASVQCTRDQWLMYGLEIIRLAPIEEVMLSDCLIVPLDWSPGCWAIQRPTLLPWPFGTPRNFFQTVEQARIWLSGACIRWARKKAGLPSLRHRSPASRRKGREAASLPE